MGNWKDDTKFKYLGAEIAKAVVEATNKAIALTVLEIQATAPVDTSSLQTDTNPFFIKELDGKNYSKLYSGEIVVGGGDFRGQTMPSTGKLGNLVDYAIYQEIKHLYIEDAVNLLPGILINLLPSVL